MARIRSIKPEFWIDEKVVDLSLGARLLFVGLWNFADDQGYIDDKPRRIKMQVFPGDDFAVEPLIGELLTAGLLVRYDSPIGPVLHVRNWDRHQKVDRAAQPRIDPSTLVLASPREPSTNNREGSPASVDAEGKGSGRDLDLDLEGKARDAPRRDGSMSVTQRAKRITDAYRDAEPMCKWPAVNAIVIKAIKAERWTDDEIRAGALRLAAEGRSVTVETLRIELDGLPPPRSPNGRASPGLVEVDGLKLKPETAARMADRARFEAMDRANGQPAAIEGPT